MAQYDACVKLQLFPYSPLRSLSVFVSSLSRKSFYWTEIILFLSIVGKHVVRT